MSIERTPTIALNGKGEADSPLTEVERRQAFIEAMAALEAQYGFTVRSSVFIAGFGAVVEVAENNPIQPGPVVIAPIANWKAAD
jgi:hypothetical protein